MLLILILPLKNTSPIILTKWAFIFIIFSPPFLLCYMKQTNEIVIMVSTDVCFSVGPIQPLYNLKVIDLHHSRDLVKTPDFSRIPNLEQLNLEECTKLVHIHPSIGILRKLVYLNLKKCTSLTSLPNNIFGVSSLKVVNLNGCSKLFHSELLNKARQYDTSDFAIQCQSTSSIFKRLKLMLPFHFFNSRRHNDIVGSLMPSLARFY